MADITYFEKPGIDNTDVALRIAREAIVKKGFKKVVLASTKGFTAKHVLEKFKDLDITFIVVGVSEKFFPGEVMKQLKEKGHHILFTEKVKITWPTLAVDILRRFCEGMKVVVQIALTATEAGLVREGEEVLVIAGTEPIGPHGEFVGGGADTVVIMEGIKSERFFGTEDWQNRRKIHEILCKPR